MIILSGRNNHISESLLSITAAFYWAAGRHALRLPAAGYLLTTARDDSGSYDAHNGEED